MKNVKSYFLILGGSPASDARPDTTLSVSSVRHLPSIFHRERRRIKVLAGRERESGREERLYRSMAIDRAIQRNNSHCWPRNERKSSLPAGLIALTKRHLPLRRLSLVSFPLSLAATVEEQLAAYPAFPRPRICALQACGRAPETKAVFPAGRKKLTCDRSYL